MSRFLAQAIPAVLCGPKSIPKSIPRRQRGSVFGGCTNSRNILLSVTCCNNETIGIAASLPLGLPDAGDPLIMLRVLSTHLFLNQRLHPGLLELAARSGAQGVEIYAARQHFDYASREHVTELGSWFRSNTLKPFSMHAPLYPDREMGRAGAPAVNLLHPEKARRIDAMDEIKRAMEAAELIPFSNLVLHLGERNDGWSQRSVEYAITALEHLGAFAHPLGVRLLVENLLSEPTTPERLGTILELGHLNNVGICLDLGHAHITVGVAAAIATLGSSIVALHVHDNHGAKDEHLWPGDGNIDWPAAIAALKALPTPPAAVLEIHPSLATDTLALPTRIEQSFALFD
jgi:sugar phosphate isomerase/epimerase